MMSALTLQEQDQWTISRFYSPPPPNPRYGLTCRPLPTLWQVSSGTELDDETKQGGKPPVKILTAVTRNLAIAARFLCEYSGPF